MLPGYPCSKTARDYDTYFQMSIGEQRKQRDRKRSNGPIKPTGPDKSKRQKVLGVDEDDAGESACADLRLSEICVATASWVWGDSKKQGQQQQIPSCGGQASHGRIEPARSDMVGGRNDWRRLSGRRGSDPRCVASRGRSPSFPPGRVNLRVNKQRPLTKTKSIEARFLPAAGRPTRLVESRGQALYLTKQPSALVSHGSQRLRFCEAGFDGPHAAALH